MTKTFASADWLPELLRPTAKEDVQVTSLTSRYAEVSDSELPRFPESAWRGVFADYRKVLEGTTEASDVSHFAALWATCAVRLGRSVYMEAGDTIFANAYICVFGPTGDKKTTAARRPRSLGLLDGAHVISNVGSAEGLADALHGEKEAGRSMATALFFWEEFGSFLSRARWKNATTLEFFTETFDCPKEWGLRYRNQNRIAIQEPTPSILTGTTSDWFWKSARPDDFHGGFGNRFIFLTGKKKPPMPVPGRRTWKELVRFGLRLPHWARTVDRFVFRQMQTGFGICSTLTLNRMKE